MKARLRKRFYKVNWVDYTGDAFMIAGRVVLMKKRMRRGATLSTIEEYSWS